MGVCALHAGARCLICLRAHGPRGRRRQRACVRARALALADVITNAKGRIVAFVEFASGRDASEAIRSACHPLRDGAPPIHVDWYRDRRLIGLQDRLRSYEPAVGGGRGSGSRDHGRDHPHDRGCFDDDRGRGRSDGSDHDRRDHRTYDDQRHDLDRSGRHGAGSTSSWHDSAERVGPRAAASSS